jgi:hypothetical protein
MEFIYCNVKENVRHCSWSSVAEIGGSPVNKQCDVRSHKLSRQHILRIVLSAQILLPGRVTAFPGNIFDDIIIEVVRIYFLSSDLSFSDKIRLSFFNYPRSPC